MRRRPRIQRPVCAYIDTMRFDGQVWFDFSSAAVWDFYGFVRALARGGTPVALEWRPFVGADQIVLASTFLALDRPEDRGRFLHAALGLVHLDGADPASSTTVRSALEIARLDLEPSHDVDAAIAAREAGEGLGVRSVPSMYRHGPVVAITVNAAATRGDLVARARTILDMLDDDGLWRLEKP